MTGFRQELVGLFGQPVDENPTQVMVEAAFAHHGLDWRYLTIEVAPADLAAAVSGARAMGFRGFHCTLPHKVEVIPHLDEIGDSATAIGAVNTVINTPQGLVGENTDGLGFLDALLERRDVEGASALVFGAGGAARAIAVELVLAGIRAITIVNRGEQRAAALVEDLARASDAGVAIDSASLTEEFVLPKDVDLVVNATSLGLFPNTDERVPVARDSFKASMLVADVIPNPPQTRFLAEAQACGCPTIDGLEMLVNQGARAIRYWAGIDPDTEVMRAALANLMAPMSKLG